MKTNRTILFLCLATLGLVGCEKYRFDKEVLYEQTFCAEAWDYGDTDAETVDQMVAFLDKNGVKLRDARLVSERSPDGCYACNCKSGRVFYGRVREKDLAAVQKLGFREQ
jgi:hypothetical protein